MADQAVPTFDAHAIAERIRALTSGAAGADCTALARRLGVNDAALRTSVDTREPRPTLHVLAAVVREFGVDPTWLLTGIYDAATHRAALDEDTPGEARRMLARMISAPLVSSNPRQRPSQPSATASPDVA
jgi:hypothetical protein